MKLKHKILIIATLITSTFFICGTEINTLQDKECTKENVYLAIKQLGIQHADIVFAQIMLESANLKSRLTITNNNFLGMRQAKKRETTAIRSKNGYAEYINWYTCICDYLLYQQNILKNKEVTKSQYLAIISKKYSESRDYKTRLNRVMRENKLFVKQQDSLYNSLTNNQY
jgi:uncharacterized FlgJ-related protein